MKSNCYSGLIDHPIPEFCMRNMGNLERLSTGVHGHLPSLKQLYFPCCSKLRYLSEDGFPPSLKSIPHNSMWDSEGWILSCRRLLAPHPRNPTHCDWSSSDPTRRFLSTVLSFVHRVMIRTSFFFHTCHLATAAPWSISIPFPQLNAKMFMFFHGHASHKCPQTSC